MSRLQRSMSTLEALAADGIPLSFSELNSKLGGIHRATLSSILKELMSLGYVHKNAASGKYECGSRLALFLNVRKEGRAE